MTEKLVNYENMPNLTKEEPKKEESESQNLLKDNTCVNSEDTKNTTGKSLFKNIPYSKILFILRSMQIWSKI